MRLLIDLTSRLFCVVALSNGLGYVALAEDVGLPHLPAVDFAFNFEGEASWRQDGPSPETFKSNSVEIRGQIYKGKYIFQISTKAPVQGGVNQDISFTLAFDGSHVWSRASESINILSRNRGFNESYLPMELTYWPMLLQNGDEANTQPTDHGMRWAIGGDPPPVMRTEHIEGGKVVIAEWIRNERIAMRIRWSFRETPSQVYLKGIESQIYVLPPGKPAWLYRTTNTVVEGEQTAGGLIFPKRLSIENSGVFSRQGTDPQPLVKRDGLELRLTVIRHVKAEDFEKALSDFCVLRPNEQFADDTLRINFDGGSQYFSFDLNPYETTRPLIAIPDSEELVNIFRSSKLLSHAAEIAQNVGHSTALMEPPSPQVMDDGALSSKYWGLSRRIFIVITCIAAVIAVGFIMKSKATSSRVGRSLFNGLTLLMLFITAAAGWKAATTATLGLTVEPGTRIDFGKVEFGAETRKLPFNFVVRNNSDIPRTLESAIASCGCTTAQYKHKTIEPGDSLTIETALAVSIAKPYAETIWLHFDGDEVIPLRLHCESQQNIIVRTLELPPIESQRRIALLVTSRYGQPSARIEFELGEQNGPKERYVHKGDWEPIGAAAANAVHWLREIKLDQAEHLNASSK